MSARSLTARLVLPALLFAASACAGGMPSQFKDPDVQLDRVVLRGAGLTGGTMDLVLKVYNPNHFTINGTRLQVGFDVQGSHVGDIEYKDEYKVEKNDTTQLTLPLTFNWIGVSGAVRSAMGYGDIPYTMKGQASIRLPGGSQVVVPFTRQGRAPLTRVGLGLGTSRTPQGATTH
jgi:LEA14-like dessication related protein